MGTEKADKSLDKSRIWNAEPVLPGNFVKFTNNCGEFFGLDEQGVYKNDAAKKAMAFLLKFSLFTYKFTDGRMMIVDLQGSFDAETRTFVLTDPVVLCTNESIFGSTNL